MKSCTFKNGMDGSRITPSYGVSVRMKVSTAWFSPSGSLNHQVKSVDNPHLRAFNFFFLARNCARERQSWVPMHGINVQWANFALHHWTTVTLLKI